MRHRIPEAVEPIVAQVPALRRRAKSIDEHVSDFQWRTLNGDSRLSLPARSMGIVDPLRTFVVARCTWRSQTKGVAIDATGPTATIGVTEK